MFCHWLFYLQVGYARLAGPVGSHLRLFPPACRTGFAIEGALS